MYGFELSLSRDSFLRFCSATILCTHGSLGSEEINSPPESCKFDQGARDPRVASGGGAQTAEQAN